MASGPITSLQIDEQKMETVTDFIILGSQITVDIDCSPEIKTCSVLGRKAMRKLDSILKRRDITWLTKVRILKEMVFPVVMYVHVSAGPWRRLSTEELMLLNCGAGEDSWASLGLQRHQTSQSERKSILDIHHKDWCWSWSSNIWPPDGKSQLIGKDPDAGKDWGQEEKGMTEDEMVGWYPWLNGHEVEQSPGDSEGQGSLVCCSTWSRNEFDTTEWLKNKEDFSSVCNNF